MLQLQIPVKLLWGSPGMVWAPAVGAWGCTRRVYETLPAALASLLIFRAHVLNPTLHVRLPLAVLGSAKVVLMAMMMLRWSSITMVRTPMLMRTIMVMRGPVMVFRMALMVMRGVVMVLRMVITVVRVVVMVVRGAAMWEGWAMAVLRGSMVIMLGSLMMRRGSVVWAMLRPMT